jgi:hypothetical protein
MRQAKGKLVQQNQWLIVADPKRVTAAATAIIAQDDPCRAKLSEEAVCWNCSSSRTTSQGCRRWLLALGKTKWISPMRAFTTATRKPGY